MEEFVDRQRSIRHPDVAHPAMAALHKAPEPAALFVGLLKRMSRP
jgi:hypothetical protein